MTDAVAAYEEKARDLWLFDYPAQVSLCGTQVWWTTEVCYSGLGCSCFNFGEKEKSSVFLFSDFMLLCILTSEQVLCMPFAG